MIGPGAWIPRAKKFVSGSRLREFRKAWIWLNLSIWAGSRLSCLLASGNRVNRANCSCGGNRNPPFNAAFSVFFLWFFYKEHLSFRFNCLLPPSSFGFYAKCWCRIAATLRYISQRLFHRESLYSTATKLGCHFSKWCFRGLKMWLFDVSCSCKHLKIWVTTFNLSRVQGFPAKIHSGQCRRNIPFLFNVPDSALTDVVLCIHYETVFVSWYRWNMQVWEIALALLKSTLSFRRP